MENQNRLVHYGGCTFSIRDGRLGEFDLKTILEVFEDNTYMFTIRPDFTVIDIGAFIGAFTVFSASNAKRVISFEPNPESYRLLEENVRLNNLTNVTLDSSAVAGATGPRTLTVDSRSANQGGANIFGRKSADDRLLPSASFHLEPAPEDAGTPVTATTLEGAFSRYSIERCDLLKMDCEGAEYEILTNTPAKILKKIGRIALEYHDFLFEDKKNAELRELLERMNFLVLRGEKHGILGTMYAINRDLAVDDVPDIQGIWERYLDLFEIDAAHKREISAHEESLKNLNLQLVEKEKDLAVLRDQVSERDRELAGLRDAVAQKDRETTGLRDTVAQRDKEIAGLRDTVGGYERELTRITTSIRWKVLDRLYRLAPAFLTRAVKSIIRLFRLA